MSASDCQRSVGEKSIGELAFLSQGCDRKEAVTLTRASGGHKERGYSLRPWNKRNLREWKLRSPSLCEHHTERSVGYKTDQPSTFDGEVRVTYLRPCSD